MDRREFITAVGGSILAGPLAVGAQPAAKVHRIGMLEILEPASNAANLSAFRQRLGELGYVENQNLVIQYRSADGRAERFPDLAIELVQLGIQVIVTNGDPCGTRGYAGDADDPDRHGVEFRSRGCRHRRQPREAGWKCHRVPLLGFPALPNALTAMTSPNDHTLA